MTNLLSQGGFGCVYYPGLKCDNAKNIKSDKKYVTKLQRKNFTSMNESNIGQIIKEIKNYDYFFLPVISQCPINFQFHKCSWSPPCGRQQRGQQEHVLGLHGSRHLECACRSGGVHTSLTTKSIAISCSAVSAGSPF